MQSGPYRVFDFVQVQVQVQVEQLTVQSARQHFEAETARIKEKLEQRVPGDERKAMVVIDSTRCDIRPDSMVRQVQSDWMKENTELLRVVSGGLAFVVQNDLLRGALTAILWAAPMPMPVTVHERLDLAIDHAIGEVARNNWGDVSPELLMGGAMMVERLVAESGAA